MPQVCEAPITTDSYFTPASTTAGERTIEEVATERELDWTDGLLPLKLVFAPRVVAEIVSVPEPTGLETASAETPSCPEVFTPQHLSSPETVMAQVWFDAAATLL